MNCSNTYYLFLYYYGDYHFTKDDEHLDYVKCDEQPCPNRYDNIEYDHISTYWLEPHLDQLSSLILLPPSPALSNNNKENGDRTITLDTAPVFTKSNESYRSAATTPVVRADFQQFLSRLENLAATRIMDHIQQQQQQQ